MVTIALMRGTSVLTLDPSGRQPLQASSPRPPRTTHLPLFVPLITPTANDNTPTIIGEAI